MKNFISANLIAIISTIGTVILGLTLYAYRADQNMIYKEVSIERNARITQDSLLWDEFNGHEKFHIQQETQRKEREELMYLYLESKFDGLEKLINAR